MTLSIDEVNRAIMFGGFTSEELATIGDAIKYRRNQLAKAVKRGMCIGDNVKFASREGRTVIGTVQQIKRKYVIVREQVNSFNGAVVATNWRVPASMLAAA
jgi:hypothetical protein